MAKKQSKRVSPNEVYSYLISKGLSVPHAIGMLANIKHESNFVPTETGDNGTSAGLFMHHNDRYENLKKFTGGDLSNWKKQIDYALTEPITKQYLKQKFSRPEEASYWFTTKWERPANAGVRALERQGYVKEFLNNRGKNWDAPLYNPEGLTEEQIYASNLPQVDGEYQPEVPVDILAQQTKRDQEVENLRAENKRLTEKEDAELAVEREKESKEKQELLAAEEEQMKQTQFADALAEVAPQPAYKPTEEFVSRNPELYQQNLGFEVQQAQNLFSNSIPTSEVQEAKYGGYFEDGFEVDDSAEFNDFYQSLPISLQSEDKLENLYSLWKDSGKVSSYNEIDTPDDFEFERQVLEEEEFDLGGTFDKLLDPNNITAFKQKYGL